MSTKEDGHVGFKGTVKFFGWIVALVVLVFEFIMNWMPATTITTAMVVKVLVIAATCTMGITAIFYIGDILWTLADKVKEKIFGS